MPRNYQKITEGFKETDIAAQNEGGASFAKETRTQDENHIEKRRTMTKNLREICLQDGIDPSKLPIRQLQTIIEKYPDKFFNIKMAQSIIKGYYFGEISTLRELLLEKE